MLSATGTRATIQGSNAASAGKRATKLILWCGRVSQTAGRQEAKHAEGHQGTTRSPDPQAGRACIRIHALLLMYRRLANAIKVAFAPLQVVMETSGVGNRQVHVHLLPVDGPYDRVPQQVLERQEAILHQWKSSRRSHGLSPTTRARGSERRGKGPPPSTLSSPQSSR